MIPARSHKRARLRGRGWHIQRERRTRTADARIRAEHPSVATRRHTTNTGRPYGTAPSSGLHWLHHPPCHPKPLSLNTAAHDSPRPAHLAASTPIRRRKPVIVVEVAVHRRQRQFGGPAEILDVAAELASHNVTIIRQDNHRLTATIVLAQPAHESLRAAVGTLCRRLSLSPQSRLRRANQCSWPIVAAHHLDEVHADRIARYRRGRAVRHAWLALQDERKGITPATAEHVYTSPQGTVFVDEDNYHTAVLAHGPLATDDEYVAVELLSDLLGAAFSRPRVATQP